MRRLGSVRGAAIAGFFLTALSLAGLRSAGMGACLALCLCCVFGVLTMGIDLGPGLTFNGFKRHYEVIRSLFKTAKNIQNPKPVAYRAGLKRQPSGDL